MTKNKYKTIYADIMPVYRESEDYCRMTLDMLKHAITSMDTDMARDAYDKPTKCFNGLAKTVEEISIRFREVSEILDDCLDDNRRPEIEDEGHSVYCVGGEHGSTYRIALLKCHPILDLDDGEYPLNSIIRRLMPHDMGYGANTISRRLRKEKKNEK